MAANTGGGRTTLSKTEVLHHSTNEQHYSRGHLSSPLELCRLLADEKPTTKVPLFFFFQNISVLSVHLYDHFPPIMKENTLN